MLHAFRSVPVTRAVYRADALPARALAFARDTITLAWEARLRARGRLKSDAGVEFGAVLNRGTVLRAGDCFVLDSPAIVVAVVERPEPVFVIEPRTGPEWALFAYYIGNGHQPLMATDAAIVCPEVPGMVELLEHHHIPFTRAVMPFTPAGGDAASHHHRA